MPCCKCCRSCTTWQQELRPAEHRRAPATQRCGSGAAMGCPRTSGCTRCYKRCRSDATSCGGPWSVCREANRQCSQRPTQLRRHRRRRTSPGDRLRHRRAATRANNPVRREAHRQGSQRPTQLRRRRRRRSGPGDRLRRRRAATRANNPPVHGNVHVSCRVSDQLELPGPRQRQRRRAGSAATHTSRACCKELRTLRRSLRKRRHPSPGTTPQPK